MSTLLPWLLLVAFLRPMIEIFILAAGEWWFHTTFRQNRDLFSRYIIQITTVGREQDRVNEIIREIRSFPMTMNYEIWVTNEPGNGDIYPEADRVITVPTDFTCVAQYKARALEFSRIVRQHLGYDTADTKITFLDDDTSPTWEYLETAYAADYDICQGVTAPRIDYGSGPFAHFILSHIDDLRFHNCMTYCSSFQGILGRPLFVHGEGLTITGHTERTVTWDWRIFASEDLTFGCNAAAAGLRWGFFHEYIQLTSPWTWQAYFKQRRRWMWGNIHAIVNRDVLPLGAAIRIAVRYFLSLFTFLASGSAVVLILTDTIEVAGWAHSLFWCSLAVWLVNFGLSGWVNAGLRQPGVSSARFWTNRVLQSLAAVVLAPVTATFTIVALVATLYMGNPRSFEVIAKTAATSGQRQRDRDRDGDGTTGTARDDEAVAGGGRVPASVAGEGNR
ncbi:beta-1,4-mannosyltransferase [Frankia sp. Hr75.2]|nr:beta-1,4-mannosyltransferase [Frankia sp. Hr75.2]